MAAINMKYFLLFTRPTERSPETHLMIQPLNYCCLISKVAVRNYFLTLATLTTYTSTIHSSTLRIHPEDWEWARDLFKTILVPELRITLLSKVPFHLACYIWHTDIYLLHSGLSQTYEHWMVLLNFATVPSMTDYLPSHQRHLGPTLQHNQGTSYPAWDHEELDICLQN